MEILKVLFTLWVGCFSIFGEIDVPLPPTNVRAECSNLTATIWFRYEDTDSNFPPPYEFRVQYNDDPEEPEAWHDARIPVKVLNKSVGYHVLKLHPYGVFAFRVVARNQHGDSTPAYAENGSCSTSAAVPESNPVGVHALSQNASQNSLVVCWRPVPKTELNGPGFHYLIEYKLSDDFQGQVQKAIATNISKCATIPDQPTYRLFDIRVWAVNSIGKASVDPVLVKGYSGEGKPIAAPTNFGLSSNNTLRGNVATFIWDPVHESTVQGMLRGYKIRYWTDGNPDKREILFGPTASKGTVEDLVANTLNYATISVENNSGQEGPNSAPISFSMQKGAPSKVNCLEALAEVSGLVRVSWKPPLGFNDDPVGYELRWCRCKRKDMQDAKDNKEPFSKNGPDCINAPILGMNETSYIILDMAPYADYVVKVAAISASGAGAWTDVRVIVGPTATVDGPTLVKPELRGILAKRYEANITWVYENSAMEKVHDRSLLALGNVSAFVKYQRRDSALWRTLPIDQSYRYVILKNLCPATYYNATIVHMMEAEPGVWSRVDFMAKFGTAEPKDDHCIEDGLRTR